MIERIFSFYGIFALLGLGVILSRSRDRIPWRLVVTGVLLQIYLAIFVVRPDWVPVVLTLAAGACAAVLVDGFRRPLPASRLGLARGLGLLGWIAVVIYAASGSTWWALLLLAAPFARAPVRHGLALAGCVLVVLSIWLWELPHDFVFRAVDGIGYGVRILIDFAKVGADGVFGGLRDAGGFVFAIEVGAIILLFGGLMSVLYHVGVLPWLVGLLAQVLHRTLGVSGAESLSAASNIFAGQTEAPLVVRPYLARMTESEIMTLMVGGFATIAGSVLGAYVNMFQEAGFARGAADLIAASLMSAPAAIVFAKILVPETEKPETAWGAPPPQERLGTNVLDALAGGVTAALKLAVNVVAMLLVFRALIEMLNAGVNAAAVAALGPESTITFQSLYAWFFAPFAALMGVPWGDCLAVGELLGTKTIFNEFLAYEDLRDAIRDGTLQPRSAVLATYALCGFANFMSIGIQIAGLSQLAPTRRAAFSRLALRAMIAGALACQLTACIVGVIGRV